MSRHSVPSQISQPQSLSQSSQQHIITISSQPRSNFASNQPPDISPMSASSAHVDLEHILQRAELTETKLQEAKEKINACKIIISQQQKYIQEQHSIITEHESTIKDFNHSSTAITQRIDQLETSQAKYLHQVLSHVEQVSTQLDESLRQQHHQQQKQHQQQHHQQQSPQGEAALLSQIDQLISRRFAAFQHDFTTSIVSIISQTTLPHVETASVLETKIADLDRKFDDTILTLKDEQLLHHQEQLIHQQKLIDSSLEKQSTLMKSQLTDMLETSNENMHHLVKQLHDEHRVEIETSLSQMTDRLPSVPNISSFVSKDDILPIKESLLAIIESLEYIESAKRTDSGDKQTTPASPTDVLTSSNDIHDIITQLDTISSEIIQSRQIFLDALQTQPHYVDNVIELFHNTSESFEQLIAKQQSNTSSIEQQMSLFSKISTDATTSAQTIQLNTTLLSQDTDTLTNIMHQFGKLMIEVIDQLKEQQISLEEQATQIQNSMVDYQQQSTTSNQYDDDGDHDDDDGGGDDNGHIHDNHDIERAQEIDKNCLPNENHDQHTQYNTHIMISSNNDDLDDIDTDFIPHTTIRSSPVENYSNELIFNKLCTISSSLQSLVQSSSVSIPESTSVTNSSSPVSIDHLTVLSQQSCDMLQNISPLLHTNVIQCKEMLSQQQMLLHLLFGPLVDIHQHQSTIDSTPNDPTHHPSFMNLIRYYHERSHDVSPDQSHTPPSLTPCLLSFLMKMFSSLSTTHHEVMNTNQTNVQELLDSTANIIVQAQRDNFQHLIDSMPTVLSNKHHDNGLGDNAHTPNNDAKLPDTTECMNEIKTSCTELCSTTKQLVQQSQQQQSSLATLISLLTVIKQLGDDELADISSLQQQNSDISTILQQFQLYLKHISTRLQIGLETIQQTVQNVEKHVTSSPLILSPAAFSSSSLSSSPSHHPSVPSSVPSTVLPLPTTTSSSTTTPTNVGHNSSEIQVIFDQYIIQPLYTQLFTLHESLIEKQTNLQQQHEQHIDKMMRQHLSTYQTMLDTAITMNTTPSLPLECKLSSDQIDQMQHAVLAGQSTLLERQLSSETFQNMLIQIIHNNFMPLHFDNQNAVLAKQFDTAMSTFLNSLLKQFTDQISHCISEPLTIHQNTICDLFSQLVKDMNQQLSTLISTSLKNNQSNRPNTTLYVNGSAPQHASVDAGPSSSTFALVPATTTTTTTISTPGGGIHPSTSRRPQSAEILPLIHSNLSTKHDVSTQKLILDGDKPHHDNAPDELLHPVEPFIEAVQLIENVMPKLYSTLSQIVDLLTKTVETSTITQKHIVLMKQSTQETIAQSLISLPDIIAQSVFSRQDCQRAFDQLKMELKQQQEELYGSYLRDYNDQMDRIELNMSVLLQQVQDQLSHGSETTSTLHHVEQIVDDHDDNGNNNDVGDGSNKLRMVQGDEGTHDENGGGGGGGQDDSLDQSLEFSFRAPNHHTIAPSSPSLAQMMSNLSPIKSPPPAQRKYQSVLLDQQQRQSQQHPQNSFQLQPEPEYMLSPQAQRQPPHPQTTAATKSSPAAATAPKTQFVPTLHQPPMFEMNTPNTFKSFDGLELLSSFGRKID